MSDQNPYGQQGWGQQPQPPQQQWGQQPGAQGQPQWGPQGQGQPHQQWGQQAQGQQAPGQQAQGQQWGQQAQGQQWGQPSPYGAPAYGGAPTGPGTLAYVEQNYGRVADFGQRAISYLIDYALTLVGMIPMIIGWIIMMVSIPTPTYDATTGTYENGDGGGAGMVIGGILMLLGALIALGIQIWNRWIRQGRTGQTVGKSKVGLKTIGTTTGQPIGAGSCFLRDLVNGFANSVVYLGWLWMLWDQNRQTLGDKVVNSTVIVVGKS